MAIEATATWATDQSDADLLLAWMSDAGEGSNGQLRDRADALLYAVTDEARRRFRVAFQRRLYELAYVETPQPRRWRVSAPFLAMAPAGDEAFWIGGRTPAEEERLRVTAEANGCAPSRRLLSRAPCRIAVGGDAAGIVRLAGQLALSIRVGCPERAVRNLVPIERRISEQPPVPRPTNAEFHRYDFRAREWTPGAGEGPVLRCENRFGISEHYVATLRGLLRTPDAATAIYMGAFLERVSLCAYDPEARRFTTKAALPREYSRPLCLCTGMPPTVGEGTRGIYYDKIPSHVAEAALRALGQDKVQEPMTKDTGPRTAIHWIN